MSTKAIVLVNNFTAQTQYKASLTYGTHVLQTLQPCSAVVIPIATDCTLFFFQSKAPGVERIGPNVTPTFFTFNDQPITKTIYYQVGGSFIVFAWLLFNPATGVAFIMPNTLLSTAFNNAFGCPAPSLGACSGFFATGPAAVVPGIPFLMTPFDGNSVLANFEYNQGHVNLSLPTAEVTTYFALSDDATPSLAFPDAFPSRQWTGIVKAAESGKNIVLVMNSNILTSTVYGLNYSSITNNYDLTENQTYLDLTTLPGLFTGSAFASLTNLSFQTVPAVPETVDCGENTNYGCDFGLNACQLEDTTIGRQFCNPSLLSAKSDLPPAYNIIVSSQVVNNANKIQNVQVSNGTSLYEIPVSYSEPLIFTNLIDESYVIINCNSVVSGQLSPNVQTQIIVNADMAPIITPVLYPNSARNNPCIEYASVTAWFDADRQVVFVSIVPQTLGGYFPLFGFLPNLYTYGGNPLLPSTYQKNNIQIGVGEGFAISNVQFNISTSTYITAPNKAAMDNFVLLTDPTTGLLTLNFVSRDANATITRLSFNGGNTLGKYVTPQPDTSLEFFGVLNNSYDLSSTDTTTSLLLSLVIEESGEATYYSINLDATASSITRKQLTGAGNSGWNWAAEALTASFVPGLVNPTQSNPAPTYPFVELGINYTSYNDTFFRYVTNPNAGGGPSAASGPSTASGPSVSGPTTGIKPKIVAAQIPKPVKMLAILGIAVLVVTIATVLILANT
jgi:hypothetical protein